MLTIESRRPGGVSQEILAHRLTAVDWRANNDDMTKDDAVAKFGTQMALAKALGMSQGSISLWGEYPPPIRQLQIEALTAGELRAEPDCDQFRFPLPQQAAA